MLWNRKHGSERQEGNERQVVGGCQGRTRVLDQCRGNCRSGSTKKSIRRIEGQCESGVANLGRERLGEEGRQGTVVDRQHDCKCNFTQKDDPDVTSSHEHEDRNCQDDEGNRCNQQHLSPSVRI